MNIILLKVNKKSVFNEIAKTTSYAGAKMEDDQAYDRIFTTDEDIEMLERFWNESKNSIISSLKKLIIDEKEEEEVYIITLGLSGSFDNNLSESMNCSMFSFFVMNITSKWFNISYKEEAIGCAEEAALHLEDIKRKALFKKKPQRPIY